MTDNITITRIKKLSPLLINQLAAGEVVTRPAAVVKELLENAIDAGATHIEVRITQGGMGMIEVVDNGSGIHPDDMVMAITRHATSKVADIATLQGINTLGFRGEALSAMAAVSRLTLISSHNDSGVGRQLQVAGVLADTPKLTPVVHNRGTTVTVKDLYFNLPARRGNLKSIGTEFAHIETIVREVALARADVTLSLLHDHKKRLLLSASSVESNHSRLPLSRLEQALGIALTTNAMPITVDLSSLLQSDAQSIETSARISGWLWVSHQSQAQTTLPKLLYVNGRLIKEAVISNQLRQLAANAQLDGIGYALYFDLPTEWLNVNVHPTKQRIKISPLNNIMAHLGHAIGFKLKGLQRNISATNSKVVNDGVSNIDDITDIKVAKTSITLDSNRRVNKEVLYQSRDRGSLAQHERPRQHVASAQASYQRSPVTDLPNSIFKSESKNNTTLVASSFTNNNIALPHCLDVLDSLPNCLDKSISLSTNDELLEQALLFYSQSQFLIITAQDWQNIWQTVVEDKLTFTNELDLPDLTEQQLLMKDEKLINAQAINQQINNYASQLSAQHLDEFVASFEYSLKKYACASINTEQLLSIMLSSAWQ
ncbi:DNA mismatch repair endonuclease MutL [Psychrobacter sp. 16-MNA-CIBAN-0192]|uniref:DNA mismatch repair endonuclease MutL n=1 Tax=Psychrobacter sp. 16-MNA-CIBAN-0192 TaxID=3140448 RepID=UPI003324D59E